MSGSKNLGTWTGTSEASLTDKIQEIETIEDTVKVMDASIKENVVSKKTPGQNIQEVWDTMKRPNSG